jgi:thiamine-monophosphate kinase
MNLRDIGEFGFIDRMARGSVVKPERVIKAIGDDAAAYRIPAGEVALLTTDLLIERIHFLRKATSGYNLGYKSLAVNLSDIAAMGAAAHHAFVSIGIPDDCRVEFLDDVYRGMKELAAEHEVNILGGDTTGSKTDLVINIAVAGFAPKNELMSRSGAKNGDAICLTGTVGDSRAGLHFIMNNIKPQTAENQRLVQAHLLPKPYLHEGRFLASTGAVHAAIDVSDGLSSDLGHILKESHAGARIYADKIPVSPPLHSFCERVAKDPVEFALAGGEDYVLACTVDAKKAESLAIQYERKFGERLYITGADTDSAGIELIYASGESKKIAQTGWDHFA